MIPRPRSRRSSSSRTAALLVGLAAVAAAAPATATAQILRVPTRREPSFTASLGAGYYSQNATVYDGRSGSAWRFGGGFVGRGSFEYVLRSGASIGIAASTARVPLDYYIADANGQYGNQNVVSAHATIRSGEALFHIGGGGEGIRQIIEVGIGAQQYRDFRQDGGGDLAPASDTDLLFRFGYGFGYALSQRFAAELVQDAAAAFHQRDGLTGSQSGIGSFFTTRLGVRVALGTRRAKL